MNSVKTAQPSDLAEQDREDLAIELSERAGFYRMLAQFYYRPLTQDQLRAMSPDSLRMLSEESPDALMAEGYNDMYRYLRRANTGTREDLNVDFTRAFMGTTTFHGLTCCPYASLFLNPGGRIMGAARNEARRFYRANGVELEGGIDLPEDHLSFEMEFLAILSDRAAASVRGGDFAAAANAIECQADFLAKHLLPWTSRFFDLSVDLVRTRFYRGVVKVTRGFLGSELETLAFLRSEVRTLGEHSVAA